MTFQYVSGYIARPKIPCCPPPSSDWMVDALGLNLAMNVVDDLVVGDPLIFCGFLEGGLPQISSGLDAILAFGFN